MPRLPRKLAPGFTLVEILVVVSIIALLVSLLLPSLRRARDQAKLAVCGSNLRQLGACIHLYAHDHTGHIPRGPNPIPDFDFDFSANDVATNQFWIGTAAPLHSGEFNGVGRLLTSVTPQAKAFFCPADDNFNLAQELPKLQGGKDAYGSYLYRQLDHLPAGADDGRLDRMGTNVIDGRSVRVEALALDMNSLGPDSFHHTNHRGRDVNVLFRDTSVNGFRNQNALFAIPAAAFEEYALIKPSIDQILTNADFAYHGPPSQAPRIVPTG